MPGSIRTGGEKGKEIMGYTSQEDHLKSVYRKGKEEEKAS